MLQPCPVSLAAGDAACRAEAVKRSLANRSAVKGWFHIGLATTMSWLRILPLAARNFGLIMVSPRASS
ncbi:hypothetical protein, partial [Xylella fastidiosa]|uniref:hypothetical protein n=1 Tax=Xylella fastidiosa TaxID=2371 RepID=UPI00235E5BE8